VTWQDRIRNSECTLCPLHASADHVCLMGSGSKKARVMILGEAPGYREDEEHRAFVGASGQLLREELVRAGIDPKSCYISNVAKCRPPDNRTPTKTELRACADEYLRQEFEAVDPDFVLLLGNSPLQVLTGKSGITKQRGNTFSSSPTFFAAFHPAYVLRQPQHTELFRADLNRFSRLIQGLPSQAEKTKVRIVRSVSGLRRLIEELKEAPVISYDIETWQSTPMKKHGPMEWADDSCIVSISFSTEPGRSTVVPIDHVTEPWKQPLKVLRALKPCLEQKGTKYVAHNGIFDCRWLARFGIFVPQTFDTMLAAHILDENRSKGLKPLSQILLGVDAYDAGVEVSDAYNEDLRKLCIYNGKDTDYTLRLYYIFREQLKEQLRLARIFARLMMPGSNVLTQVVRGGMYTDKAKLQEQLEVLERQHAKLRRKMCKWVPVHKREAINFNSYPQVGEWLFKDLGLNPLKQTSTGNDSTDEETLLSLVNDHPAVSYLLKNRGVVKNLGYLRSWEAKLDDNSRIHTSYKLYGTVTGRLSSEKPNLQQVPREGTMRTVFGAPPGKVFLEADYSQVELRVAAMLAGETTLLRIFATGGDPHLTTAAKTARMTPAEITASDATGKTEYRKKAKGVNFGFLYDMGAEKFIQYATMNFGWTPTLEEAEQYRRDYFALYPKLRPWHDRQRRLVHRYQRVHSPIGRVRHLPDVLSGDRQVVAEAERQAINSPVQSFASDLMLLSMVQLSGRLRPSEARIVGTVHDAILFEVREDVVAQVAKMVKTVMEDMTPVRRLFGTRVTVPIEVEIKVGQFWGGGKVLEVV
jgi:uracil-DNA glycosylase family 4